MIWKQPDYLEYLSGCFRGARTAQVIWVSENAQESVFGQRTGGERLRRQSGQPRTSSLMKRMRGVGAGDENIDVEKVSQFQIPSSSRSRLMNSSVMTILSSDTRFKIGQPCSSI